MLGRESAMDVASADERGGRIALVESDDSKAVDMILGVMYLGAFQIDGALLHPVCINVVMVR
jgi:hypothetical protein